MPVFRPTDRMWICANLSMNKSTAFIWVTQRLSLPLDRISLELSGCTEIITKSLPSPLRHQHSEMLEILEKRNTDYFKFIEAPCY